MQNSFNDELNSNAVDAINNDKAFFTKTDEVQMPIINNSFTGNPITGANYVNLKLSNDLNDTQHTEYVKMNEVISSRPEWVAEIPEENRPKGTLYQEEGISSDSQYSFVVPTVDLNQDIFQDNLDQVTPRNNYVPFQTNNSNISNFGEFFQEQLTNAINASFTGTPYKNNISENEMDSFKATLIDTITKNPAFLTEVANKAYQNVMDFHYVPFNRDSFIEKARDENSNEFEQLNSAITEHVEDIYNNKKPSFNKEFNDLAQPLIINIENLNIKTLDLREKKSIISKETKEFIKEKIKEFKPGKILTETFVGTAIEKAVQIAKIGKQILAGVALVCSVFRPELSTGFALASTLIPNLSSIKKIIPKPTEVNTIVSPKSAEKDSEQNKIVINGKTFQGTDLLKILNFDNEPFSITGNEKPTSHDFSMAHIAEKAILGMFSQINKDEYLKEMATNQMNQFVEKVAVKVSGASNVTTAILSNHVMKVAEIIIALQEFKGDKTLRTYQNNNDTRSLYAGINQAIRDNPKLLDQAVSKINQEQNQNQNQNQKKQSTTKPRR
jgi:fructose-specific phosphotransferase system component IIB